MNPKENLQNLFTNGGYDKKQWDKTVEKEKHFYCPYCRTKRWLYYVMNYTHDMDVSHYCAKCDANLVIVQI